MMMIRIARGASKEKLNSPGDIFSDMAPKRLALKTRMKPAKMIAKTKRQTIINHK